jgi:adenylate cyclase
MKHQLAAILHADVVDYSRLTGKDEERTHERLNSGLDLLTSLIQEHSGEKINEAGDAILAEFGSAIDSVYCAIQFQLEMARLNTGQPDEDPLEFRVGVNLGEVIHNRGDIYGDGVNISARIQEIAEPGGIFISSAIYEQVRGKVDFTFDDLGHRKLKNIEQSIHTFRVHIFDFQQEKHVQPLFDFDPATIDRSSLITGRCLCGSIRFEINQPPVLAVFCHCRMCQRASGDSPVSASASFPLYAVRFVQGETKIYKSSSIAERGFCGNCGSTLTYRLMAPNPSQFISISIMCLDNPKDFAPAFHTGIENQMPWLDINDDLPRSRIDESPELRKAWEYKGVTDSNNWDEKH